MIVRELGRESCLQALATAPVARLACSSAGQPYVMPMFLAYHKAYDGDDCLYGFTTHGQKVEWMRANPLVCVEVDCVTNPSEWISVVAFGHFEELANVHEQAGSRRPSRRDLTDDAKSRWLSLETANEQLFAHRLLEKRAMWWEPAASVRDVADQNRCEGRFMPVFYKIRLTQITGFEAFQEVREAAAEEPLGSAAARNWLEEGWQRIVAWFERRHTQNCFTGASKRRCTAKERT